MQSSIFNLLIVLLLNVSVVIPVNATATQTRTPSILILGDSLSAAHNISIEQSWPVLFHHKLRQQDPAVEMVNASISGETTQGGLQRLPDLLLQHHPTHLIVELGGNDGLRGYKFNQTRHNLQSIVDLALAQHIRVLLIGVRMPPNLGPQYNQRFQQIYEQLANDNQIAYLPRFLDGVAADRPEYMQADGIHPTELAQPLLADKVFNVFENRQLQLDPG
jgi:acyl-CoA thioesterase-1